MTNQNEKITKGKFDLAAFLYRANYTKCKFCIINGGENDYTN